MSQENWVIDGLPQDTHGSTTWSTMRMDSKQNRSCPGTDRSRTVSHRAQDWLVKRFNFWKNTPWKQTHFCWKWGTTWSGGILRGGCTKRLTNTLDRLSILVIWFLYIIRSYRNMAKKKTLEQKKWELDQKYKARKRDLIIRTTKKYDEKCNEEIDRKRAIQEKNYQRDLHNLEVSQWEKQGEIKKKPTKSTDYANACRLAQLYAKLRDTWDDGAWPCICCPWSRYSWDDLDGWHFIPKSRSKATALDLRNINAQARGCNRSINWWWKHGREDAQKPLIDAKRGAGTVDDLKRIKRDRIQTDPVQFIVEYLYQAETLLLRKKLDPTKKKNYLKKIRSFEIRYFEKASR